MGEARPFDRREHLFKIIFMDGFHLPEEMDSVIENYFDCVDLEDEEDIRRECPTLEEREQIRERFFQVRELYNDLDNRLNAASEGWKTSRMSAVDLAILRLAVYEMEYDPEVPIGVAINEAVELGKVYGGSGSYAFINGILGNLARKKS